MKTHIIHALAYSLILLVSTGCDRTIHEYPQQVKSLVVVELNADRTPPTFYKEVSYNSNGIYTDRMLEPSFSEEYTADERLALRFVVELYRIPSADATVSDGVLAERRVLSVNRLAEAPQDTLHFYLPDGNYRALGWADYVPKNELKDWHFETSALNSIKVDLEHKPQNNHHKSSAAGWGGFTLGNSSAPVDTVRQPVIPIAMKRPSARFKLWSTDWKEYQNSGKDTSDLNVRIEYIQYISAGYDVESENPNFFTPTRQMETTPSHVEGDSTVLLAYDYVLTSNDQEDYVLMDVVITDKDGNEINRCQRIAVPLRRNQETIVKGPFLTEEIKACDIGIDDSFSDEHVIIIPD